MLLSLPSSFSSSAVVEITSHLPDPCTNFLLDCLMIRPTNGGTQSFEELKREMLEGMKN